MAGLMADYLSSLAADYTTTELSVAPQKVLVEESDKNQVVHESDDPTSLSVTTLSDQSVFTVTLQWTAITDSDAQTIYDFYNSSTKANARENTFYWQHPTDGNTYTAMFLGPMKKLQHYNFPNHREISQIKLRVLGTKP